MGIKGLTSFMDRYDFLFSRHQLYDTKVIIDGNNLAHCLYHDGIDSQYGGDYDKYAEVASNTIAIPNLDNVIVSYFVLVNYLGDWKWC